MAGISPAMTRFVGCWQQEVPTIVNAQAFDRQLLKLSLSPIAHWVDDPEVTDILVYGSRHVYVRRRGGTFERVGVTWYSDADMMTAAKTIGR
jgi:Flp pilus assembly CpaF family ATPase